MKRLIFTLLVLALMATTANAGPSLHFSTIPQLPPITSWTLAGTGNNWTLTFSANSMEVDITNPSPDPVFLDIVTLPIMNLTALSDDGVSQITATLTNSGSLTITDDTLVNGIVMTASVGNGGMLTIGTTYVAYSQPMDDLNITGHVPLYSSVIDSFVAGEAAGLGLDLSFTGSSTRNLYQMISNAMQSGGTDFAVGTIDGNIVLIPAPGAIILGSIGVGLVGWLRRRKSL